MPKEPARRADVVSVLAEAFREHGYEGASMAVLTEATGLGKGSLYHFFPGGKDEMAAAVLEDIDRWFRDRVFAPLRSATGADRAGAREAVDAMLDEVDAYFRSGRRVCLPGAFALGRERERFEAAVTGYFTHWVDALEQALRAAGRAAPRATAMQILAAVQGGIVLARALQDPAAFSAAVAGARALTADA